MTTVFVDATKGRTPREIYRDARDPQGPAQEDLERWARRLSTGDMGRAPRRIRMYGEGPYMKRWRQQKRAGVMYEAFDGQPTDDYKPLAA